VTDEMNDRPRGNAGIEYVLEVWNRRKWVALLAFAAAFAVFISLTVWLPDLYRATATVLVETQQLSEAFVMPSVTAELETRIQTIRQEVMSRVRLGNLITQLNLYPDLRKKGVPFDDVVEQMRRDIELDLKTADPQMSMRRTIAFAISYSGRDPQTVARVANVLASVYVDENTNMRVGQAARTAEVLRAQLADAKQELDAQEARTSQFKLSHIGELPEQIEANLASLDRLNVQLRLNAENQIRVTDRRERLEKQLADAGVVAPVLPPPSSPRAAQLAKLRQEIADLRRQFTDEYPDVVRARAELAALERQGSETVVTPGSGAAPPLDSSARLNQALAGVETELKALKEEEIALRRAMDSYDQRVENVPKRQEEFQALSRDYATTKERYGTLLKKYEEAQLAESLEQGRKVEQFRLLDPAMPPREPFAPGRLGLVLVGFLLSIALAVAAVLATDQLDTSFHGIEDLRAFVRVPTTLFSIPLLSTAAHTRRQWRRMVLTAVSAMIGLGLIVAGVRHVATGNERIVRLVAGRHA